MVRVAARRLAGKAQVPGLKAKRRRLHFSQMLVCRFHLSTPGTVSGVDGNGSVNVENGELMLIMKALFRNGPNGSRHLGPPESSIRSSRCSSGSKKCFAKQPGLSYRQTQPLSSQWSLPRKTDTGPRALLNAGSAMNW